MVMLCGDRFCVFPLMWNLFLDLSGRNFVKSSEEEGGVFLSAKPALRVIRAIR